MWKAFIIAASLALAAPLHAQNGAVPVTAEILTGWREAGGRHVAGLAVRLAPGWKTYWRAPGEGGIPPRFNWSGSRNLASVEVLYPIPKVMDQFGIQAIGYDSDVVFPLLVTPKDGSQPIALRAEVDLGICEEVCIPMTLRLRGDLPANGAPDPEIAASLKSQPVQGGSFECEIEPIADGLRLTARIPAPDMDTEVAVIEIGEQDAWVSPSQLGWSGGNLFAMVEVVPPAAQPFTLSRGDVRMTVLGHGLAVDLRGCR